MRALRIAAIVLLGTSTASAASPLITAVQPFVDRGDLAGAVMLVSSNTRAPDLQTVGYSDLATHKPMAPDSLFWIASMSKPITATALMMLVDEGKIRLDDPVTQYLPDFNPKIMAASADGAHVKLQSPRTPILVRHLLSHRSGIAFSSSLETPTLDTFPLALRVESYAMTPLMAEPGTAFQYSNAGINTAARIIEVVSKMKFETFLQQRLFDPLRMNDTTFWPTDAQLSRLAKAYTRTNAASALTETPITQLHYPLTDRAHRYPMPAGGLFSTAGDLVKFCQMLANGGSFEGKRYITQQSIDAMTQNQGGKPDEDGYALGWATQASGSFGHGGAYATNMTIDPKRGLITLWLVQHAGYVADVAKAQEAFEHAAKQ